MFGQKAKKKYFLYYSLVYPVNANQRNISVPLKHQSIDNIISLYIDKKKNNIIMKLLVKYPHYTVQIIFHILYVTTKIFLLIVHFKNLMRKDQ